MFIAVKCSAASETQEFMVGDPGVKLQDVTKEPEIKGLPLNVWAQVRASSGFVIFTTVS